MNENFQHIATVSLKHSYFQKGTAKSIRFSIDEATRKRMRDIGIILKVGAGEFYLFSSTPSLLATESLEDNLNILFFNEDPYYINYTHLTSFIPSKEILYFDNLDTKAGVENNTYVMHIEEHASKKDSTSISNDTLKIPSFEPHKSYIFKDANGMVIPKELVFEVQKNSGIYSISRLPEGIIKVYTEEDEATPIFTTYHSQHVTWHKPLGIISLFTHRLFEDYTNHQKVDYTIHFSARKTFWKYFFMMDSETSYRTLTITHKQAGVLFERLQDEMLSDNKSAIVFQSIQSLPLQEKYENYPELKGFRIVDETNENNPETLLKLPVPSSEQLHIETSQNEELFYSHIYIYY